MAENSAKTRNWVFITGLFLTVISSVVIGVFNIGVLYLFGIPILTMALGVVFVWIARISAKVKIFVTLSPILVIPLSFYTAYQLGKAEPETFLVPNIYRGEIVVFYDEPCGREPKKENGRRIYEISNKGVLITKFKKNQGILDQEFFLVEDEQNRIEIPYFRRQNFETEKKEWTTFQKGPNEEFTRETVGAFFAYGRETYFLSGNSLGYIISNYHYFERDEKERWREGKHFAEVAGKLLKECRETQ